MNIIKVPISKITVWKENPRRIKKRDFDRLKKQIQTLGLYKPLICYKENGQYVVLGGNMRLPALRELGYTEVDISVVDAKTPAKRLEYALSDNDRAGEPDDQALAELIFPVKDVLDLDAFRFDMGNTISIENLLNQFGPRIVADQEDDIPEAQKTSSIKRGDFFELGRHRLLCGDAMVEKNYKTLLEGKKADLVFTDPPWNVNYKSRKDEGVLNDEMDEEKFITFACDIMARIRENTKSGGVFYICSGYSSYAPFVYAIKKSGMVYSSPIVWVKDWVTRGFQDYRKQHEMILRAKNSKQTASPILYGWNHGRHYFTEDRSEADVWTIKRRATTTMVHPTQKPLALVQRAIRNSSRPNERILDPFAGSGSTIIAAEREGRTAHAKELDPVYCDVMIRRFAGLGGPTEAEIRATRKKAEK